MTLASPLARSQKLQVVVVTVETLPNKELDRVLTRRARYGTAMPPADVMHKRLQLSYHSARQTRGGSCQGPSLDVADFIASHAAQHANKSYSHLLTYGNKNGLACHPTPHRTLDTSFETSQMFEQDLRHLEQQIPIV